MEIETFDAAWRFLESSYIQADGNLLLTPTNWVLTEDLNDSINLRYLCLKCKNTLLIVDELTNAIVGLYLEN